SAGFLRLSPSPARKSPRPKKQPPARSIQPVRPADHQPIEQPRYRPAVPAATARGGDLPPRQLLDDRLHRHVAKVRRGVTAVPCIRAIKRLLVDGASSRTERNHPRP